MFFLDNLIKHGHVVFCLFHTAISIIFALRSLLKSHAQTQIWRSRSRVTNTDFTFKSSFWVGNRTSRTSVLTLTLFLFSHVQSTYPKSNLIHPFEIKLLFSTLSILQLYLISSKSNSTSRLPPFYRIRTDPTYIFFNILYIFLQHFSAPSQAEPCRGVHSEKVVKWSVKSTEWLRDLELLFTDSVKSNIYLS